MGYNTTVVVMNDALSFIEADADFGKNLARAIMEVQRGKSVDVPARTPRGGVHCNAATVIETHHADYYVTVRVGRNYGEVVTIPELGRKRRAPDAASQINDEQIKALFHKYGTGRLDGFTAAVRGAISGAVDASPQQPNRCKLTECLGKKAAEGLTEVRGIFAPPARHAEVREAAAKALKPKRAKRAAGMAKLERTGT